ncbi:MAG: InlB B-repeat-containing protein, partial [Oscillospiraceae bacterium]|nr:InlB B-repeat-containing protein [Oscillospiraceae bacterium]
MNRPIRKILALLLALSLVLGLLPAALAAPSETEAAKSGAAEQTEPAAEAPAPNGMRVQTPYGLRLGGEKTKTRAETRELPSSYNSVDLGIVTSVKNQTQYGQYGTCWAFGTLSPIETYMIKNGMSVGRGGAAATTDLDLSEYHLSYFTYSNSYDEHGLTNGDSSILQDESHLNVGGDGYKATLTLMRWIGAASEEEADLAYSEASPSGTIDPKYAYAYDVAHVTSVDWIEPSDTTLVKQYLQEYGSAFIGYYYNPSYQGRGGAYCYISTSANNDYGPNHGVTLVGWDDNYSKSNFTGLSKPQNNGAWIIKNSWGNSSYTDHGYTYISYEDTSYLGHPIMFFTVESLDSYDHLYQYDGTCFTGDAAKGWIPLTQNRSLVSNVFTAAGHETVEAFSICTLEEGLGYTLEVYKNPTNLTGSNPNPASGTLMSTQNGTIAHSGYHTIRIKTPFKVEEGDKFSAVFTLDSQQGGQNFQMVIPVDESQTEDYTENGAYLATLTHTHVGHPGTSFFRLRDNANWSQLDNGASLRIKAYTTDAPFDLTVESGAHGTAVLGDYSSMGYLVTATPDSGYYTSGYTILSGSAAVIQNGSKFYVNPTEATTIRIEFAAQSPFTLRYSANGQPYGSPVTGMTGDAVTLPLTAAVFEGYTFLGWSTAPVPDAVTGKPLYLEPGTVYYPLGGETTLYALYSFDRLAVPGQDGSYVKISSAAEFTDGRYLIVNEASLHALDGSKANSTGKYTPINTAPNHVSVTINSGRIPDSATLRAADFRYDSGKREFFSSYGYPVGGYKDGLYFYVWGTESLLAAQTVSFDANGNALITDDYYHNTLYYNRASNAYFAYQTAAADPVQLYRKTEDTTTTYYSTAFNATPAVTWTVSFETNGGSAVPAQTVPDGYTATQPAAPTKDGFAFAGWYSDAALTQAYAFSAPVTADLTLYAKWEEESPAEYTVRFESNGGSAVASQTVLSGQTVTRPADPAREGFRFLGWFADAALTNAYDFSAPVTGNLTLYAKWEEIPDTVCTVSFNSNGGSAVAAQTVESGETVSEPPTPTREGCSFDGWYTDAALSQVYDFAAPVTESFTLYAAWKVCLSFLTNGVVTAVETVRADAAYSLPAEAALFEGWSFLGWTAAPTEETQTRPAFIPAGEAYTPDADTVLHALYTRSETSGGTVYRLVTENLTDWTGNYVITKGSDPAFVLTGLDDGKSYETESNGGAVAFANTGASFADGELRNVPTIYSFTVAPIGETGYYSFQNAEKGNYLLSRNTTLYADAFNQTTCRWSISVGTDGLATIRNPISSYSNVISFSTASIWGNVFLLMSSATDVCLWRETEGGAVYYTTVIDNAPQEPILDPSLRLFYSVSTEIEIVTQYSVIKSDVQSFDSWYVEISKLDADGNPTETK